MNLFSHQGPVARTVLRTAAFLLLLTASVYAQQVQSPDGAIEVRFHLDAGNPGYEVSLNGKTVLESSPLGLETSIGSFAEGLKLEDSSIRTIEDDYVLPHSKVREVHYESNELTVRLTNANNDTLETVFRVSNRDVAFSYRIAARDKFRIVIEKELSGFDFPKSATVFATPQARWGGGFAKTKPSYEEGYIVDEPVGTKSWTGLGFTFPALFKLGNDGWVLISETGTSGKYAGCKLSDPTADGLYSISFPEKEENAGLGAATVSGSLPFQTPWRTITIGETLAPIIESTVATDVVEPLYEAAYEYKPGRSTWSWILWQDASMNEKDQRAYIDLAAEMGYEYILIDALWDRNIGREKMAEMVKYANSKNVDVLLWYNSNGYWNDAPQSPRNCLDSAPARQKEMAWMQSIGVKGMKVDFFGGDKQTTIQLYEDILTDANIYGLCLNFHGATLPRGWERMYPNHMTSEAVTASENLVFSQGFADGEARNSTIFPFVRNPVAAMDYGPMFLNKRFNRNPDRGNIRRTTDAFQLATTVTFQSPIQHFALTPNNLEEQPDYVIDFLKKVPAVWDETRYVDGYPGEFIVLARRTGKQWYVAATHAGKEERELTISLPGLKGQSVDLLYDKEDRTAGYKKMRVGRDGKITLTLAGGGGAVLVSNP
ncbi:MAG: glycoside hydrolase family 97 protein [Pontiellaceae bacterium]|nr:glycoside hydrolase family 97 protein [Pontiellaceae bacterium]MBN2785586.1 glycoside hydrolase family 97 protein [Pontiellaceae bacterium]